MCIHVGRHSFAYLVLTKQGFIFHPCPSSPLFPSPASSPRAEVMALTKLLCCELLMERDRRLDHSYRAIYIQGHKHTIHESFSWIRIGETTNSYSNVRKSDGREIKNTSKYILLVKVKQVILSKLRHLYNSELHLTLWQYHSFPWWMDHDNKHQQWKAKRIINDESRERISNCKFTINSMCTWHTSVGQVSPVNDSVSLQVPIESLSRQRHPRDGDDLWGLCQSQDIVWRPRRHCPMHKRRATFIRYTC